MKKYLILGTLVLLSACSAKIDEKELSEVLKKNPDLVFDLIKDNPDKFMQTVQNAARRGRPAPPPEEDPQVQQEAEFKNPKQPEIDESRIVGKKSAPVVIVEYSDLECPFCARGSAVMSEVKKAYPNEVKVIFKHLPLPMHPNAMPAARYYEAIVKAYSVEKASEWSEVLFREQSRLRGMPAQEFFDDISKKVKVNPKKVDGVLKDSTASAKIDQTIRADMAEAQKFNFQGTPGFLINGVSIKGAYPAEAFKSIIDRHLKK